jgi:hypothetical protein
MFSICSMPWRRWNCTVCEGWSLEIGTAFCGSVVRQNHTDQAPSWLAVVNAALVGEYVDRALAMARVQEIIRHNMEGIVQEWRFIRAASK